MIQWTEVSYTHKQYGTLSPTSPLLFPLLSNKQPKKSLQKSCIETTELSYISTFNYVGYGPLGLPGLPGKSLV